MPGPVEPPVGLVLAATAKVVSRAFDDALGVAGGSRVNWLVLLALKTGRARSQRELAAEIGIEGATMTHHLTAMEADGLVERVRDPANRRVQVVTPTEAGEALFLRLRAAAQSFDRQLRLGIPGTDLAAARAVLAALERNATAARPTAGG